MMKKMILSAVFFASTMMIFAGSAMAEPKFGLLGAPYNMWLEGSQGFGEKPGKGLNEGLKMDTRLEQGLEIAQFGHQDRFKVVPFVALRLTVSDQQREVWNNRIAEEVGLKVTYDVPVNQGHWGQVAVGVKGIHRTEFRGESDIGGQVFVTVGFGGNWLHKK